MNWHHGQATSAPGSARKLERKETRPQARRDDLLVEELADETLLYDLKRHQAYCLNRTAALVWRRCDGRTTVSEMAPLLAREPGLPADEGLVWMTLGRLRSAGLLEKGTMPPVDGTSHSRREIIRKLGLVGGLSVLLPLVQSIGAPTPAQAASCVSNCSGHANCTPCADNKGACTKVCSGGTCKNKAGTGCP
jgi:hypothetical protein